MFVHAKDWHIKCWLLSLLFNLFITYLWLHWVFVAACRRWMGAALWLQCTGFSLWWLLGLQSTGSRVVGVRRVSCPVACGIYLDSNWTRVRCIGRRILNHWTTREVHYYSILITHIFYKYENWDSGRLSTLVEPLSHWVAELGCKPKFIWL